MSLFAPRKNAAFAERKATNREAIVSTDPYPAAEGRSNVPIPNPQSPIPPSCDRRATLAVCGLLVLAVGLVFGQTARFSFVDFDDDQYVYANSMVCHGLTAAGVRWAFTTSQMSTWHPLTWLSLMLECRLFRLNAGAITSPAPCCTPPRPCCSLWPCGG